MIQVIDQPKKLTAREARERRLLEFTNGLHNWVPNGLYLYTYNRCIYCGEEGDTIDHVFPVCFLTAKDRCGSMRTTGVTVDSCRECNCRFLGPRIFPTFRERLDAARETLRAKYRKVLSLPHWEDAELKQLSGALQLSVKKNMKAREITVQRLEWQESPEFFEHMDMLREQLRAEQPENEQLLRFFGADAWSE